MGVQPSVIKEPNKKSLIQTEFPDISIAFKATQQRLLSYQKNNTNNQESQQIIIQQNQKENINQRAMNDKNQQQQQQSYPNNQNQKIIVQQEPQKFQEQILLQKYQDDSDPSFYSIKQTEIEQNDAPLSFQNKQENLDQNVERQNQYKQKIVPQQLLNQQEHPKFLQIKQPQPQFNTPVQSMQQTQFDNIQQNDLLMPLQSNFNQNQNEIQSQVKQEKQNELLMPLQNNFNIHQNSSNQNQVIIDKQKQSSLIQKQNFNIDQNSMQLQINQDKLNELMQPLQNNIPNALCILDQNQDIANISNKEEEDQVINFDIQNQVDDEEIDESPNINNMQMLTSSYNARVGNFQNRNTDLMSEDASQIIEQKCFICSHNIQSNYLMLQCQHQIHKNCAKKSKQNNQYVYHCICGAKISNHLFA